MERVVLIQPPHSFAGHAGEVRGYMPPLGLLYLTEILRRRGHEVIVLDMDTDRLQAEDAVARVRRHGATVVGISVFTRTRGVSYRIAERLRAAFPALYIALGGPHCTIAPEEALRCRSADAVVQGEAEDAICDLVERRPRGLVRAQLVTALDDLPFPDLHAPVLPRDAYGHFLGVKFARRSAVASSSRGCPRACTFCMRVGLLAYRARSPQSFVEELRRIADQGYTAVIFNDDNFLANTRRVLDICELMVRARLRLSFAAQCTATPSPEVWRAMREAGLVIVCVGVEHVEPAIVTYFGKTRQAERWKERVQRTLAIVDGEGIVSCGSFIAGAPMETREQALALVRFLDDCRADFKNSNELLYAYGTQLWKDAVRDGLFPASRFHVRASEVFPEKAAYLDEVNRLAWRLSMKALPRVVGKLLRSPMRDKHTAMLSLLRRVVHGGVAALRESPNQGYGRQVEA